MVKSLLIAAFLTAILVTAAHGQSEPPEIITSKLPHSSFDFGWGGARAAGMGNAYLGLADDITAGAWNPAGLVVFEGPSLGVSWGATAPSGYTNYTVQSNLWRQNHSGSLSSITGLNFVGPFRVKGHAFVGSVNYTRNFEDLMGVGFDSTHDEIFQVVRIIIPEIDTFGVDVGTKQILEGGLNSVSFSLGTRVYKNNSFGLGLNIYTGKSIMDSSESAIIDDMPISPGGQEALWIRNKLVVDTVKFSGWNVTLAYKATGEKFNVGVVLRTPFSLNLNTNRSIYRLSTVNGVPTENLTDTTFFDNQLTKYTMPLTVSGGVAYKIRDNAVLTMDAEYRNFGSLIYKRRDSLFIDPAGNNEEFFTDIDPNWNSTFSMRFGGEYRWESSIGTIPLRAGLGLIPIPWPNKAESKSPQGSLSFPHLVFLPFVKALNNDDTPIRYTFSAGSGIHWSQIMLDWSYTYSTVERNWGSDIVSAQMNDHHFGFTFTGVF